MTTPSRTPRIAQLLGAAALFGLIGLPGIIAACGVESPIPAARRALERGQLDKADGLLAQESDPESVALRTQIRKLRERREQVLRDLDELLDPSAGNPRGELLAVLRKMLAAEEDALVRERIEQELSRVADRPPARREPTPPAPMPDSSAPGATAATPAPAGVREVDPIEGDSVPPVGDAPTSIPTEEPTAVLPASEEAGRDEAALVAAAKDLRRRLEGAGEDEREALHAELTELAQRNLTAALELAAAMASRWAAAAPELARGQTLADLKVIATQREKLDVHRAESIALIRDEETYFYPFQLPAVSFEDVHRYALAQRAVEGAVEAVREIWEGTEPVVLPPAFRAALREITWLAENEHQARGPLVLPDGVPDWILGQSAGFPSIGIAEFAWTRAEAGVLQRSRATRKFNERQWSALGDDEGPGNPTEEEREQVRITNRYRAMMGLPALAWNSRLMLAVRWHSDFMEETGEMGHSQPEPARHSPFDRMSLAGYANGACENVHFGFVPAHLAHESWIESSQHHRNILDEDLREMASARSGRFWTQNFGVDEAFLKELDGWRH